jgi:Spy/CpxP family protein refolding chaperone
VGNVPVYEDKPVKKLLLASVAALSVLSTSAAHADPINLPSNE